VIEQLINIADKPPNDCANVAQFLYSYGCICQSPYGYLHIFICLKMAPSSHLNNVTRPWIMLGIQQNRRQFLIV